MTEYLITLDPIDRYFFGGDMMFPVGDDKKDAFNTKYASYIIESSRFPQQTSLLGMLRFLLLSNSAYFQNGKILSEKKSEVAALIGKTGFRVTDGHRENEFGKIVRISECRLQHKGEDGTWADLEPDPLDKGLKVSFEKCADGRVNGEAKYFPNMEYDAKEGLSQRYSCNGKSFSSEEIFAEDRRIGIRRDIVSGKTDDDALYKQISYRLRKGFRFAFTATVKDCDLTEYDGQLVSVGGDGSYFRIGISKPIGGIPKPGSDSEESKKPEENQNAVVLTSPVFLETEDLSLSRYAITGTIPFRFIKTDVDKGAYDIVSNKSGRSSSYQLYTAGSVFYFIDSESMRRFISAIEAKKDFRQIGYNQYKLK